MDHASKEIFVNHFKIISSQDENIRNEAIEKGWASPKILVISKVVIKSEMVSLNLFAELKISQTITLVIDQVMLKLVWFLSLGTLILLKEKVRQSSG